MEPIICHANITEEPDFILKAEPPYTYIGVVESLLPGIRALADTHDTRGTPLALLSAHVLECLLKAFLSKTLGSDSSLKKRGLRHNLLALWQLSKEKGLALPDQTPSWVESLNVLHDEPYYLRYAKGLHFMVSPAPQPMVSDLHNLLAIVKDALH